MPPKTNYPPLPRIVAETLAAAICLFTLPLSFDWLGKAIHHQGDTGRAIGVLLLAVLGVILLFDVYRMMRQRSAPPETQNGERR